MRASSVSMLALATLSLVACDRPQDTRIPSVAPEAIKAARNATEPPPLPTKTDVNAAETEAIMRSLVAAPPGQPSKNGPDQGMYVAAQEAAAKAPDTASADQAKKGVLESGKSGEEASTKPQAAELSKSEEASAMPKPGQANDHSNDGPVKSGDAEAKQ